MYPVAHIACRYLGCTVVALGSALAHAEPLAPSQNTLGINTFNEYISGQHSTPRGGVTDPYTGQEVEVGTTLQNQFTAPYMSYLRESQSTTEPGLNYELGHGLSLNYDPTTRRVHTEINLTGDDKKRIRLRVKPGEYKAVFTYKWN